MDKPSIDIIRTVMKLDSMNYPIWKFQITLALKRLGLYKVMMGEETKPLMDFESWVNKDQEAQASISGSIQPEYFHLVQSCETSHDMWKSIEATFSDKSEFTRQCLMNQFFSYEASESKPLGEIYREVVDIASNLRSKGEQISDMSIVTKIVSSLPDSKYKYFKASWDSVPAENQTLTYLQLRLRKQDQLMELERGRKKETPKAAYNLNKSFNKMNLGQRQNNDRKQMSIQEKKKKYPCRYCNRLGHFANECFKRKKDQEYGKNGQNNWKTNPKFNKSVEKVKVAFALTGSEVDSWFIQDSGTGQHISGDRKLFSHLEPYEEKLYTADKKEVTAKGKGVIPVMVKQGNFWKECILKDVLFIEGARNLFSIPTIIKNGFKVITDRKGGKIIDQKGNLVMTSTLKGELLVMDFVPKTTQVNMIEGNNLKLWHNRLCHINNNDLRRSVESGAVSGIQLTGSQSQVSFCEDCVEGKLARLPYPRVEEKRSSKPGEVTHVDTAGPFSIASLGGSRYFTVMVDDASGFLTVYCIKNKSEFPEVIKSYMAFMKNQTANKMKAIRSDNAREFVSKEVQELYDKRGIVHEHSVPYCPQGNGKAERAIRTIKEGVRVLLNSSGLPDSLWAEAANTFVYCKNRLLNSNSKGNMTPYQMIFGKRPKLGHIKIFGSMAFAHVPEVSRSAWDRKAKKLVLVGFDPHTHHYRLYDSLTHKIETFRNVVFNEKLPEEIELVKCKVDNPSQLQTERKRLYPSLSSIDDNLEDVPDIELNDYEIERENEDGTLDIAIMSDKGKKVTVRAPKNMKSMFVVPEEDGTRTEYHVTPELRDRSKLKKTKYYQAGQANLITTGETLLVPTTYREAMNTDEKEQWEAAMREEINSLLKNKTWTLVQKPDGVKPINGRWVFARKYNSDGSVKLWKSRFVAKGFQQIKGENFTDTYAPVTRYASIRILLALAAINKMEITQCDIKTAFLNATLEEDVYMFQPEGWSDPEKPEWVCKLNKSIYGLKQSPMRWNQCFSEFLAEFGLIQSKADPCIYCKQDPEDTIYISIYVDDVLCVTKKPQTSKRLMEAIKNRFDMRIEQVSNYVGLEISRDKDFSVIIKQKAYIENILNRFGMIDAKPISIPMQPRTDVTTAEESDEKFPYQEVVGSLIYLTTLTRPDLAFAVGFLARFMSNYNQTHWKMVRYVLRYIKATMDFGIKFHAGDEIKLVGYSDASFAECPETRKSTTGYLFMMGKSPIIWNSSRQPIVTLSSTESEYVALCSAVTEEIWIRKFLREIGIKLHTPTPIMVDNLSSIGLAKTEQFHKRSKHIDTRFHFVREQVAKKEVDLQYIDTNNQLADILTKPLLKTKFENNRNRIGIQSYTAKASIVCLLVTLAFITSGVIAHPFIFVDPIQWRESPLRVATSYQEVYMKIRLSHPCELINEDIVHRDIVAEAKANCLENYRHYILDEFSKICTVDKSSHLRKITHKEVMRRQKRDFGISLAAVGVILLVSALWNVGVTAWAWYSNYETKEKLREGLAQQDQRIVELLTRVNTYEEAVEKLNSAVKVLLISSENTTADLAELKQKFVRSVSIISHITNRLLVGRDIIRSTAKLWKKSKMNDDLFDYMNFEMDCEDRCPMDKARFMECYINPNRTTIDLRFDLFEYEENIKLMFSDTFQLTSRTSEGNLCVFRYKGPKEIILDTTNNCIIPLIDETYSIDDIVLINKQSCINDLKNISSMELYEIDRCLAMEKEYSRRYVKFKNFGLSNFIYCNELNITIGGEEMECPDRVFMLSSMTEFNIGNYSYRPRRVQVTKTDTSFNLPQSIKINRYLRPQVHINSLIKEIEKSEENMKRVKILELIKYPVYRNQTMIVIICILIAMMSFSVLYYTLRIAKAISNRGRVRVSARVIDPPEPRAIATNNL